MIPRDFQKHRTMVSVLYDTQGVLVALDQRGIDNEGGSLVNVFLMPDHRRFRDDADVVDGHLVHGTAMLSDVLAYVRQKFGQPLLPH